MNSVAAIQEGLQLQIREAVGYLLISQVVCTALIMFVVLCWRR